MNDDTYLWAAAPTGVTVTETVVIEVPVDDSEVSDEQLRYDLPEIHPTPEDYITVDIQVSDESTPVPQELGILAVLLDAFEDNPVPQEDVTGTEAIIVNDDDHPVPQDDLIEVDAFVQEQLAVPYEELSEVAASVTESQPVPLDDVTGTEAVFVINETSPTPSHTTEIDIEVVLEQVPTCTDDTYVRVTGITWPRNASTITTGDASWSNPHHMADNDTTTSADCTVESGGIGGLSSQSGTGTVTARTDAPLLTDLNIVSVELSWGWHSVRGGSATGLLGDEAGGSMSYSTNDGATHFPFDSVTKSNDLWDKEGTLDLTSVIDGDWDKIDQFRVRCIADITSGTGVGTPATRTVGFEYARLSIVAEKTY